MSAVFVSAFVILVGLLLVVIAFFAFRDHVLRLLKICPDCTNSGTINSSDGPWFHFCECEHGKTQKAFAIIREQAAKRNTNARP